MFNPPIFREDRIEIMHELMRRHPFAMLVSSIGGELSVDHIPLVLHEDSSPFGVLRGHVAAANPLARISDATVDVLAIFQGPQAYISPSWYPSKAEHGKVVPTWNYVVAHAKGQLRFCSDRSWLLQHLNDLTDLNERDMYLPWAVTDAPRDFLERQLKGILGIEIDVRALQGKWKVSQNKSEQDRQGASAGLARKRTAQADAMSKLIAGRAQ